VSRDSTKLSALHHHHIPALAHPGSVGIDHTVSGRSIASESRCDKLNQMCEALARVVGWNLQGWRTAATIAARWSGCKEALAAWYAFAFEWQRRFDLKSGKPVLSNGLRNRVA
jgi:hypothetical protein